MAVTMDRSTVSPVLRRAPDTALSARLALSLSFACGREERNGAEGVRERKRTAGHRTHSPFKKLRWFSKIWLISWIHVCRTLGLDECRTKVSATSPVRDVRANLQGSFSTFSSRQRQLTCNNLKRYSQRPKGEATQVSIPG